MRENSSYRSNSNGLNPAGVLNDIVTAWRLLWSPGVPGILKLLLPLLALVYWISPLDLIPGVPIDDVAVLILIAKLFVQMAPRDVVDQLNNGARRRGSYEQTPYADPGAQGDVYDDQDTVSTTWRVIDDDEA